VIVILKDVGVYKKLGGWNMSAKDAVIETMKAAGKPLSAGEIEKLSGLNRKDIDKAFKELKDENAITSPIRCKWEPVK
jgi:predicted transcriptional regulator